jgi:hypothetical protein
MKYPKSFPQNQFLGTELGKRKQENKFSKIFLVGRFRLKGLVFLPAFLFASVPV